MELAKDFKAWILQSYSRKDQIKKTSYHCFLLFLEQSGKSKEEIDKILGQYEGLYEEKIWNAWFEAEQSLPPFVYDVEIDFSVDAGTYISFAANDPEQASEYLEKIKGLFKSEELDSKIKALIYDHMKSTIASAKDTLNFDYPVDFGKDNYSMNMSVGGRQLEKSALELEDLKP